MLTDILICLSVAGVPALLVHLFNRHSYKRELRRRDEAHHREINRIRSAYDTAIRDLTRKSPFFQSHILGSRSVR